MSLRQYSPVDIINISVLNRLVFSLHSLQQCTLSSTEEASYKCTRYFLLLNRFRLRIPRADFLSN